MKPKQCMAKCKKGHRCHNVAVIDNLCLTHFFVENGINKKKGGPRIRYYRTKDEVWL